MISKITRHTISTDSIFYVIFFFFWRNSRQWARASSFSRFLDHTQPHTTIGRTPLDERSASRRNLYLTTHNTHNKQDIHSPGGNRIHNFSKRAAADLSFRRRGQRDRLMLYRVIHKSLRDFRTRLRNNQDRHGRKEHINR